MNCEMQQRQRHKRQLLLLAMFIVLNWVGKSLKCNFACIINNAIWHYPSVSSGAIKSSKEIYAQKFEGYEYDDQMDLGNIISNEMKCLKIS